MQCSPFNSLDVVSSQDSPIFVAPVKSVNAAESCTICGDFDGFEPHIRSTCPSKNKCTICTVVRRIDPEIVNHRSEDHNFQRKRPPRFRKRNRNQHFERPVCESFETRSDGRGRPFVNRGCVPYPPVHENSNHSRNDLTYADPVTSSYIRRNLSTLRAKNSNPPPRRIYTAAI